MAKAPPPKQPSRVSAKPSGEKQKPIPAIVTVAAKAMKKPETVTMAEIQSLAARILDDQKNDPKPHKPTKKP